MNIVTKPPRARSSSSFAVGLVVLLGSLPGCYIDAKIGDDPEGGSAGTTDADTIGAQTTATTSPGNTSGPPGMSTTSTTGGDPSASEGTAGVSPEMALELCGAVVVPPEPGGPVYNEGIVCSGGCAIDVESSVMVGLFELGECLCDAILCGDLVGGTTGELPGDGTDSTTGEPDGCGPFPPGAGEFTCSCEMCSIDVTSVDAVWIDSEADLPTICECMCGGAGCGSPV